MSRVANIWGGLTARWAAHRHNKLIKALQRDSLQAIQLMEFDGAIYICHYDTPIINIDHLSNKAHAVAVIRQSREKWIKHKLQSLKAITNNH